MRIDQGENVKVAFLMLEWKGIHCNPVLVGPFVHNKRIERLW